MTRSEGRTGHGWRKLRARVKRHHDVCWICGKPIDKTLDWPHPQSFTVDHKEPLSLRPDLARNYDNLAAAHFHCNSSKGDGDADHIMRNSRDW